MTFARAVTGTSVVAALLAVVALAPLPAAAGPVVQNSTLVCADVVLGSDFIDLSQSASASGTAKLELTGAGNANVSLTVKASGLPPSTPAACAIVCVVNGVLDLLEFEAFTPCGMTTAGGKLTFTGTLPLSGPPFEGGCLLPIPALLVRQPLPPPALAPVPIEAVVCAPGFGTFDSICLGDCPV